MSTTPPPRMGGVGDKVYRNGLTASMSLGKKRTRDRGEGVPVAKNRSLGAGDVQLYYGDVSTVLAEPDCCEGDGFHQ